MIRIARWFALLLILVFALTACAPTTTVAVQPTATPAPTLAPTITPDAAQPLVLVLPGSEQQKTMIAVNRHYSDVVKRKGWNVDFYTVQQLYSEDGSDSYIQYIAKQLASGATRADGYFGGFARREQAGAPLDEAKAKGLLYDCAAAAPQVVPDYWARFQDQIVSAEYGLPLCYASGYRDYGYALVLRKELRGLVPQKSMGYDDVRALLENQKQSGSRKAGLSTNYRVWLNLWLRQQGYMPLFENSGICTRTDDPDAQPVLLENVPGFEAFFKDTFGCMRAGILDLSFDMVRSSAESPTTILPIVLDDADRFLWPGTEQGWSEYTVVPLQTDQAYSNDIYHAHFLTRRQQYSNELVIPARSRRAADAMAFVQWVYASRENAECLMYGQPGEDFTLQGERIALSPALQKPLSSLDWYGEAFFTAAAKPRIAAGAPEGAEDLAGAWAQVRVAAPWTGHLMDQELMDIMYQITDKRQEQIIQLNSDLINGSLSVLFDAGVWMEELRHATPENYLQPFQEALQKARSMEK